MSPRCIASTVRRSAALTALAAVLFAAVAAIAFADPDPGRAQTRVDAGDDLWVRAHQPVRLGAGGGVQGDDDARVRWRVVDAPRGARFELRGKTRERPLLAADTVGTYVLRLTADGDGPDGPLGAGRDTLTVTVTPDDPPIGVELDTLHPGSQAMRIDGRGVEGTRRSSDESALYYLVLERATRREVAAGNRPRSRAGLGDLIALADRYKTRDRYLMIVSGYRGIEQANLDLAERLLKLLGGADLTAFQKRDLGLGVPFTLAGVAGGATGSAWTRINRYNEYAVGAFRGLLQRNTATQQYDLVSPDMLAFDTDVPTGNPRANKMRIGGNDYTGTLPAGRTAGFHVVAINPINGLQIADAVYPVDGQIQAYSEVLLAAALEKAIDGPGQPVVFVQTIGRPVTGTDDWNHVIRELLRLGATRSLIASFDGSSEYAFVGRLGGERPSVEVSSLPGTRDPEDVEKAQLSGILTRTHAYAYEPLIASPNGGQTAELPAIAYQDGTPFPAFSTPGQRAAQTAIGEYLRVCSFTAASCDIRRMYYESYRAAWGELASGLRAMTYPGEGRGFSAAEFSSVKAQLLEEMSDIVHIKTYFEQLSSILPRAESDGQVDVRRIAKEIYDAIQPAGENKSGAYLPELFEHATEVAGLYFGGIGSAIHGLNAVMGLISFLSDEKGKPVAGSELPVRADALATQLRDNLVQAQEALIAQQQLIVSDWGKMQAVTRHILSDWRLPASDAITLRAMRVATGQWVAGELFGAAFPDLVHTMAGETPRQTSCGFNPHLGTYKQRYPWRYLEPHLMVRTNVGYAARATQPYWVVRFATRGGSPPTRRLGRRLFDAPTDETPGLGIDPLRFFDAKNFDGRDLYANPNAPYCDLPFSHDFPDWMARPED
ncbi:hypothetical protein [Conexibacter sp. CPCC 206217]|uniref:hypothetical protein n=1 Tax=Conexibacter sp. CPCC 206217 TaxID=3064574 RepID=UPI00271E6A3D|nr:hypothetical protein [Conexibacter sp. CPCC 206217]MDO8212276.1 hypothetical protein [Conexibacter sp. CPCC 206217]